MSLKIKDPPSGASRKSINNENGRNCGIIYEPENTFKYNKAPCEVIVSRNNNAWIVLGRDRMGEKTSGYGGKGHGKDSSLDLVVGRLSSTDATTLKNKSVNPSPFADAARLYLSQKTDIDNNFNIASGKTGLSTGRSGAVLKADAVRIVARESLKIVTGTDAYTSTNDIIDKNIGVQLIGGNSDKDMQPMVKGLNLISVLVDIVDQLLDLNGIVDAFITEQRKFNSEVAHHKHLTKYNAQPTSVSPKLQFLNKQIDSALEIKVSQGLINLVNNCTALTADYLLASGESYIVSTYHYLN